MEPDNNTDPSSARAFQVALAGKFAAWLPRILWFFFSAAITGVSTLVAWMAATVHANHVGITELAIEQQHRADEFRDLADDIRAQRESVRDLARQCDAAERDTDELRRECKRRFRDSHP